MRNLYITLFAVFLTMVSMVTQQNPQQIDDSDTGAMIKASFLYQFASNNDWPAEDKKGKFTIGIYGNPGLYKEMAARYGAKPAGSQVVEVVEVGELSASSFMHIIYIDKSRKAELAKVLKQFKDKHTLIVTSFEGGLTLGAVINFKTVDSNIRYELSEQAAKERRINLGVKILQWAVK